MCNLGYRVVSETAKEENIYAADSTLSAKSDATPFPNLAMQAPSEITNRNRRTPPKSFNAQKLLLTVTLVAQLGSLAGGWLLFNEQTNNNAMLKAGLALDRVLLESGITSGGVGYNFGSQMLPDRSRLIVEKYIASNKISQVRAEHLLSSLQQSATQLQTVARSAGNGHLNLLGDSLTAYLNNLRHFVSTRETSSFPSILLLICIPSSLIAVLLLLARKPEVSITDSPPTEKALANAIDSLSHLQKGLTRALTMGTRNAKNYLDSMPAGLLSADENGLIQAANIRSLMMLRCTIDSIIGVPLYEVLHLHETDSTDMRTLLNDCPSQVFEARLKRRDGSQKEIPVDMSVAQFETAQGKGYVVNIVDVSDRYEIERLKQDFLSMVSHDLRTPLTSIGIFLQTINSEDPPCLAERFRESALNSEKEVGRLIRMVTGLLDIARIRSGKLELNKKAFDLDPFFQTMSHNLAPLAEKHGIDLVFPSVSDFVVADKDRIYQVLENLIGNAIKFSPAGASVIVEVKQKAHCTYFAVEDSGPGIPHDKKELIFERFGQVSLEDATVKGGTGLGLAICKLIVEQHGGEIGVDSPSCGGSRFWFTLPD